MKVEIYRNLDVINEVINTIKKIMGPFDNDGIGRVGRAVPFEGLMRSPPPVVSAKHLDRSYFIVPILISLLDDQFVMEINRCKNPKKVHRNINEVLAKFLKKILLEKPRGSIPVFFQYGDRIQTYPCFNSGIVFKHSACLKHPQELGAPYSAPVKSDSPHTPISQAKILMSFQGCSWGMKVRQDLVKILPGVKQTGHQAWVAYTDCWKPSHYKKDHEDLLENSIFILCPRGVGLSSVRFFEAMSKGRLPILISDQLRLPLDKVIPYSKFMVRVPESDIKNTVNYVAAFVKKNDVNKASKLAHQMYMRHLANNNFEQFRKSLETYK